MTAFRDAITAQVWATSSEPTLTHDTVAIADAVLAMPEMVWLRDLVADLPELLSDYGMSLGERPPATLLEWAGVDWPDGGQPES
jgi:hypothetical protein